MDSWYLGSATAFVARLRFALLFIAADVVDDRVFDQRAEDEHHAGAGPDVDRLRVGDWRQIRVDP